MTSSGNDDHDKARFETIVRTFWLRDWEKDVALLDTALARPGQPSAGFVVEPPSVLTGDPFSLPPGEGLVVLGINPKWQGDDTDFQRHDVGPARDAHARRDFQGYRAQRARYSDADSPVSYDRYFTRLGNALAAGFHATSVPTSAKSDAARRFLKEHVAKFDLIPWWSVDADGIAGGKVSTALPPIMAWAQLIRGAVEALRPRAVVVNGTGWRRFVEELFGTALTPVTVAEPTGGTRRAYVGRYGTVPVLAHAQLNSPGGASHAAYPALVAAAGIAPARG